MTEPKDLYELSRPIPAAYIKEPAPGKHGDYVPHPVITQRLLAVVGPYEFRLIEMIRGASYGKTKKGETIGGENVIVGAVYELTCTIDGRMVSIQEIGHCDNAWMQSDDGARAKKAASDAIKRCAMRLGVGLHMWCKTPDEYFLARVLRDQVTLDDGTPHDDGEVVTMGIEAEDDDAEAAERNQHPQVVAEVAAAVEPKHHDEGHVIVPRERLQQTMLAMCEGDEVRGRALAVDASKALGFTAGWFNDDRSVDKVLEWAQGWLDARLMAVSETTIEDGVVVSEEQIQPTAHQAAQIEQLDVEADQWSEIGGLLATDPQVGTIEAMEKRVRRLYMLMAAVGRWPSGHFNARLMAWMGAEHWGDLKRKANYQEFARRSWEEAQAEATKEVE